MNINVRGTFVAPCNNSSLSLCLFDLSMEEAMGFNTKRTKLDADMSLTPILPTLMGAVAVADAPCKGCVAARI